MIAYRIAEPGDAPAIAELAREIWTEYYTPLIGVQQVSYMLEKFQSEGAIEREMQTGGRFTLALHQDAPVGYLLLRPEDNYLFLSKVYVLKSHRGQGVAKRFFEEAEAYARELKLPAIRLTVNKGNEASLSIYRHLGYRTIDAVVSDIGGGYVMDDFIMEKKL